eukprot:m.142785 g.142785  ORF g.142785 m.142785 type:complete len:78 (-) comp17146_c2_seq2:38-271(-)
MASQAFSDYQWLTEEDMEQFDEQVLEEIAFVDEIAEETAASATAPAPAPVVQAGSGSGTLASMIGLNVHAQEFKPGF